MIQEPVKAAPAGAAWMESVLLSVQSQSWLASLVLHLIVLVALGLIAGTVQVMKTIGAAPSFQSFADVPHEPVTIEPLDVSNAPLEPSRLDTDSLLLDPLSRDVQQDEARVAEPELPGLAVEADVSGGLPVSSSWFRQGVMLGQFGSGHAGDGPGGSDLRNRIGSSTTPGFAPRVVRPGGGGQTKITERAVTGALNWIARHQNANGSWSLDHRQNCKSGACSGPGEAKSDAAATALALLPFLAAGQTHQSDGPYRRQISAGVNWLLKNQRPGGDLSAGGTQMYSHGLATLALCEAYGMTQDSRVGLAAQSALRFIESGQNREGAWRYEHGTQTSDTSVYGWQVMALKSGQMAGLQVSPGVLDRSKQYLKLCASGKYDAEFSYMPQGGSTQTMTSVGLLATQYLGAKRSDPAITGGVEFLLKNKPSLEARNTYYWYYATQVMHNVPGPEWDEWNRQMRKVLVTTQDKQGCAAGSWNPAGEHPDPWGNQGGRLMVTSLSALTLEVYYRYLPLYQLDKPKLME